jgi:A/G-specific adenine glycosylase
MLGGMLEIPNSGWHDRPLSENLIGAQSPIKTKWVVIPGLVRHSFTHFNLELTICAGRAEKAPNGTFWCPKKDLESQALPSLMRKVVALVQMTGMNLK